MTGSQIEDRINDSYYQPERPAWDESKLPEVARIRELNNETDRLRQQIAAAKRQFQQNLSAQESRRLEEFKVDCLVATKLSEHPKAEMAYNQAWERGHGNGLYDVYLELCDLAELLL